MGTQDSWTFLILFAGFFTILCAVTVLIAHLETFVPAKRPRSFPQESNEEAGNQDHDEPTAA